MCLERKSHTFIQCNQLWKETCQFCHFRVRVRIQIEILNSTLSDEKRKFWTKWVNGTWSWWTTTSGWSSWTRWARTWTVSKTEKSKSGLFRRIKCGALSQMVKMDPNTSPWAGSQKCNRSPYRLIINPNRSAAETTTLLWWANKINRNLVSKLQVKRV